MAFLPAKYESAKNLNKTVDFGWLLFLQKESREQFQISSYKRLIDIYSSTSKTVDALLTLELPCGVEVEIKV